MDGIQIRYGSDFARGMAKKGRFDLLSIDAAAVIRDADIGLAAFSYFDSDRRCTGIDGILDQFLYDGNRAVHDLPGSDLICYIFV